MKKKLVQAILGLGLVATALAGSPPSPRRGGLALTILVDTSWSCGDDMTNFRTLGRQAAAGLRAGDILEIITAQAGRPRIRLAQTIQSGSPSEMAALAATLAEIHDDGLFAEAPLSDALQVAFDRLDYLCAKRGCPKAMALILSDGHVSDRDASGILQVAEEFRKRAWPLYVTGDRGTHRSLLIAASRGKITWSHILEANPGLTLQQLRESIPQGWEKPPSTAPLPETKAQDNSQSPSVGQARPAAGSPTPPPDDIKARWKTELDVTVSGSQSPRSAAQMNEPSSQIEEHVTSKPPVEPNRQNEVAAAPPAGEERAADRPRPSWWARTKSFMGPLWLWLVAAGILPCAGLGYIIVQGRRQARELTSKSRLQLKDKDLDSQGLLVAKFNGQTYHLGQRSQLATVHIGSGVNTTIRTPERGISDRHVRLYRRGAHLMVRNIGAKPITVNSLPLRPRAKQRLVLPAVIELTENTKLTLSLLRPKDTVPAGRSEDHEPDRQP